MGPFFLSWIGPVLFFSSVLVSALGKGTFEIKKEGFALGLFFLQNIPRLSNKIKPFIWILALASLFIFDLRRDFILGSSLVLASVITLYGFKERQKLDKDLRDKTRLNAFFEKRLLSQLETVKKLEDKLDVFLQQELSLSFDDDQTCVTQVEDYNEELDFEEKALALSLQSSEKAEKKPLKRLRRIVMKQTSFFDEDEQSSH